MKKKSNIKKAAALAAELGFNSHGFETIQRMMQLKSYNGRCSYDALEKVCQALVLDEEESKQKIEEIAELLGYL